MSRVIFQSVTAAALAGLLAIGVSEARAQVQARGPFRPSRDYVGADVALRDDAGNVRLYLRTLTRPEGSVVVVFDADHRQLALLGGPGGNSGPAPPDLPPIEPPGGKADSMSAAVASLQDQVQALWQNLKETRDRVNLIAQRK